jgi:hypothetical protein
MTDSDRLARQTEAMQEILTLYPADLLELIAFVNGDAARAGEPCDSGPLFPEEGK